VTITGTTVMHGSIIHDLIEGKDWADAERIKVHHFPGIIEDPVTGEERSLWPAKWTLEYLRNERKESPRSYAKNFENRPVAPGGTFWDDNDITYTDKYLKWTTERILILDPAAKSKKTNDETGIALLSYSQNARKTTVERVTGVREKPTQLRELVHRVAMKNGIRLILVDVTNGGDHVLNTLMPLPRGVKILPVHIAKRSKDDRFSDLHDLYQRGAVVHAKLIPELEAQMKAYPRTLHDDRIDAVAIGVEYFVKGFPGAAAVAS
jgi:predicted phage terminase large subunit-like protein